MEFNNIKIIVSEIDGIITDGRNALDYLNNTIFKNYCVVDFDAINELKTYFTFVFLSSDPAISYNVMRSRNIPTYFSKANESKIDILTKKILPKYKVKPTNLLYLGSTLSDVPCMKLAQISMVSEDSFFIYKGADYRMPVSPGNGVLSYLAGILNNEILTRKCR